MGPSISWQRSKANLPNVFKYIFELVRLHSLRTHFKLTQNCEMRFKCSLFHFVFTFNKCNKLSRHFITKSLNKNKIMLLSTCVIGGIFLLLCRPVNPYGQHLKYQNVFFSSVPGKSLPFIPTDIASQLSRRRSFVRFFATFQFVVIFHIQHLVVLKCQLRWIMQTCVHSIPYKSAQCVRKNIS